MGDDYYRYDGPAQVTARDQGALNGSRTGINGTSTQEEEMDESGVASSQMLRAKVYPV